jgi:heterodisulfide reductase subunit A-like polyferredoxin
MEPAQDNTQLQEKLYKEHGLNDLQVEIYMATLNTEIGLEISEIQKMFPKLQTNLDSLNQLLNTVIYIDNINILNFINFYYS